MTKFLGISPDLGYNKTNANNALERFSNVDPITVIDVQIGKNSIDVCKKRTSINYPNKNSETPN